jgi:hypothetical protein
MEMDAEENGFRSFNELEVREKAAVVARLSGLVVKGVVQDWLYTGIDLVSPNERRYRQERLVGQAAGVLAVHNIDPAFAHYFV